MVREKIEKIAQLEKELKDWSEFARIMKSKSESIGSSHNYFWSVSYYVLKLFGRDKYDKRHDLGKTLNEDKDLIQLNYDFAIKKVAEIEKQIIEL